MLTDPAAIRAREGIHFEGWASRDGNEGVHSWRADEPPAVVVSTWGGVPRTPFSASNRLSASLALSPPRAFDPPQSAPSIAWAHASRIASVPSRIPVQIGYVAALAETVRAERHHALAAHRAEPGVGAGWPSSTVTTPRPAPSAPACRSIWPAASALARAARARRRQPAGVQPVRAGDRQQPSARHLLAQLLECRLGLGRDRTLIGQRDARALGRAAPPSARRRSPRPGRARAPAAAARGWTGAARPPSRPAAACGSKAWRSRIASSSTWAGSKLASRSAAMPISGVLTRLVLPALRRQGQPDGVETSRKRASW